MYDAIPRGDNLWLLVDDPSALTTEHSQPPPVRGLVCQAPAANGNQSNPTALQAGDFFVSMSSDRPVTAELIALAVPVVKRLVVDFSEIDPQHVDMSCLVWIGAMRNLEVPRPHPYRGSWSPHVLAGAVAGALSVWRACGRNLLSGQTE